MKKIVIMMMIFALLLVSCKKDPIKIGLVATLTGGNSEIGTSIRDSFLLKVKEVNDAGGINGRMVELITRDDQNDQKLTKKYSDELIDMGVEALLGFELSSKYGVVESLHDEEVIIMSPTLSSHLASGLDDNFFRTIHTNINQGEVLATRANENKKNTLIVYDSKNFAYAEGVIIGYESLFKGDRTLFPVDDLYNNELQLIKAYEEHDSVLLVMNPGDCATVAQLFYKNNIQTQFYSSSWGMISDAYKNAGKSMEGFVFASHIGNSELPSYIEFVEKYKSHYLEEPQFAAVYAYEAALMYFTALENTDDFSYESVKESMLALKDIEGIISVLKFDQYGDINRSNYIATLVDGKLIIEE